MKVKIESINLLALNPELLKNFYIKVFGFKEKEVSVAPDFYMIGCNGCNLSIQNGVKLGQECGFKGFEIGIEVEEILNFKNLVLENNGKIINDAQKMNWGEVITVADPEGHNINIYCFKK